MNIVKQVRLVPPQGSRTVRHAVNGSPVSEIAGLQIAVSTNGGVWLLYLDAGWREVTDTFHLSVDAAMQQADAGSPRAAGLESVKPASVVAALERVAAG